MEFSFASLLIGLIIGAIAGAIGGLWWQRSQPEVQTARKVAREHEQLKNQVADHFVETAQRVNQLTDSYKDVMDHLRQGAINLVDRQTLEKRLPQSDSEAVTVMRISSGEKSAPASAGKPGQQASGSSAASERGSPGSAGGSSSDNSQGAGNTEQKSSTDDQAGGKASEAGSRPTSKSP